MAGGFLNPLESNSCGNPLCQQRRAHTPGSVVDILHSERNGSRATIDGIDRNYAWIIVAVALSLVFIFVLGRGIVLHR